MKSLGRISEIEYHSLIRHNESFKFLKYKTSIDYEMTIKVKTKD